MNGLHALATDIKFESHTQASAHANKGAKICVCERTYKLS